MKKSEIIAALTEAGIEHDPKAKAADLAELLPEGLRETPTAGGSYVATRPIIEAGIAYAKGDQVHNLTPERVTALGKFITPGKVAAKEAATEED